MIVNALTHLAAFLVGGWIVYMTLRSAVQTFILPRSANDPIAKFVFLNVRKIFALRIHFETTYEGQDRILAFYAPISLLSLIGAWLLSVCSGYALLFWSLGIKEWSRAFTLSGSSLFTLGFATSDDASLIVLTFTEAALGMILVALLIGYLPTLYGAWSRRESLVTMLEIRAGSPTSPVEMLVRYHRLNRLHLLGDLWEQWEIWFADIGETHTSLASLPFFRSPQSNRSWITAAGTVLDAAALTAAIVDIPHNASADICIRAGYVSLREISRLFRIHFDEDPEPEALISVTKAEFMEAYQLLHEQGVPLKPDPDAGWLAYSGWRVNYDQPLVGLARMMMAPPAPWSSDRYLAERAPILNVLVRTQSRR